MLRAKTLGLTLVAVIAFSAVAVASASATHFKAEKYPVKVKSESTKSNNVFKIGSTEVKCTTANFASGSIAAETESIKVLPEYKSCTAFGFVGATVNMHGCEYKLTTALTENVSIECTGTNKITIEAGGCTVSVGSQSKLSKVKYTNIAGPPKEVEVTDEVAKIKYSTNGAFACPAEGQEAKYTGTNRAFGVNPSKESEHIGIEVS